jgi:hypothetical protein
VPPNIKELPNILSKERENRRHASVHIKLFLRFFDQAMVSSCVGVTLSLVFVRKISVPCSFFFGHTNHTHIWCVLCCFHNFVITPFDIWLLWILSTFDNTCLFWSFHLFSTLHTHTPYSLSLSCEYKRLFLDLFQLFDFFGKFFTNGYFL